MPYDKWFDCGRKDKVQKSAMHLTVESMKYATVEIYTYEKVADDRPGKEVLLEDTERECLKWLRKNNWLKKRVLNTPDWIKFKEEN